MLLGLRGVGKTVLLVRIAELAESAGYVTALIEAPEERRLAQLLVPKLRSLLYRLSKREKARVPGNRALGALRKISPVGPLDESSIREAIRVPVEEAGAEVYDDALSEIAEQTEGYPYFLQVFSGSRSEVA